MGFLSPLDSINYIRPDILLMFELGDSLRDHYALSTVAIKCIPGPSNVSKLEVAMGVGCFGLCMDSDNRLSHSVLVRIHIGIYWILYTPSLYRKRKANHESRGFGFFYQPIQKSKDFVINLETRAEPMPVDNEDTNDPLATTASQASSADIWSNANDIVGLEPLSLLTQPNTDRQEPHWSTQILAQLEAVSSYENHGQPHAPRYGEILVSSHDQAPRPRHDQGLAAVSSSYQLPMATMSPTQVLSPITRPSHLLRTSRDPTRADVVSWLHSIDLTLPNDLTPPATPTDLHSVRPEQLPPIAPSAVAPETAALSQDMPSPGNQIVPHRQAEERWSSRSRSSYMPSSGNQVTWERTKFFHASHSRS